MNDGVREGDTTVQLYDTTMAEGVWDMLIVEYRYSTILYSNKKCQKCSF